MAAFESGGNGKYEVWASGKFDYRTSSLPKAKRTAEAASTYGDEVIVVDFKKKLVLGTWKNEKKTGGVRKATLVELARIHAEHLRTKKIGVKARRDVGWW